MWTDRCTLPAHHHCHVQRAPVQSTPVTSNGWTAFTQYGGGSGMVFLQLSCRWHMYEAVTPTWWYPILFPYRCQGGIYTAVVLPNIRVQNNKLCEAVLWGQQILELGKFWVWGIVNSPTTSIHLRTASIVTPKVAGCKIVIGKCFTLMWCNHFLGVRCPVLWVIFWAIVINRSTYAVTASSFCRLLYLLMSMTCRNCVGDVWAQ